MVLTLKQLFLNNLTLSVFKLKQLNLIKNIDKIGNKLPKSEDNSIETNERELKTFSNLLVLMNLTNWNTKIMMK